VNFYNMNYLSPLVLNCAEWRASTSGFFTFKRHVQGVDATRFSSEQTDTDYARTP